MLILNAGLGHYASGLVKRSSGRLRWGDRSTGGEPLWNIPKNLVIFFPERGRPNKVLNRRLPRTTARDVLSKVRLGDYWCA
jgi:hypothetical protein